MDARSLGAASGRTTSCAVSVALLEGLEELEGELFAARESIEEVRIDVDLTLGSEGLGIRRYRGVVCEVHSVNAHRTCCVIPISGIRVRVGQQGN